MKVQYSCHVVVSADRGMLNRIMREFDPTILRPVGEVDVDDRGSVIVYSFECDSAIDVERLAEASGEWPDAKIEAVWIINGDEVGSAAIAAGAFVDFSPRHKFMLIDLLYASLDLRR